MRLTFARCCARHPAAKSGASQETSLDIAFDANPGPVGCTELSANRGLPLFRISGHLDLEFQDNPPKWTASLNGISAVRFLVSTQQNHPMCSPL